MNETCPDLSKARWSTARVVVLGSVGLVVTVVFVLGPARFAVRWKLLLLGFPLLLVDAAAGKLPLERLPMWALLCLYAIPFAFLIALCVTGSCAWDRHRQRSAWIFAGLVLVAIGVGLRLTSL